MLVLGQKGEDALFCIAFLPEFCQGMFPKIILRI